MESTPKNFGLIGIAGYIAVRHLKAIKDTGNNLLASLDKFDCVGLLDGYFPQSDFFVEFERFDRHFDKLKRLGTKIDYVSICSPNYLHDSHIRFALRQQADAICEKPIVLNPWNVDALQEIENETGRKTYTILQLRLHPAIRALREKISKGPKNKMYDIDLTYITSWKTRGSGGSSALMPPTCLRQQGKPAREPTGQFLSKVRRWSSVTVSGSFTQYRIRKYWQEGALDSTMQGNR